MGHHHHGGGGGHHHHHGHRHHPLGGGGWGYGYGYGPRAYFYGSWPLALAFATLLCGYGLYEGIATYRVYAHGEHGMGVVTHVEDGTTLLQVNGHVCALSGEYGRAGGMLPVAFRHGAPGDCVVHRLEAFRWPGGALFIGVMMILGIVVWRRGGTSAEPQPPPANKPAS